MADEPYHQTIGGFTDGPRYAPGTPAWNNMVQNLTSLLTEPDKHKAITDLATLAIDASGMIAETGMIKQRFADAVDGMRAHVDNLADDIEALKTKQADREERLKDLQTTNSPPSPRQWLKNILEKIIKKPK